MKKKKSYDVSDDEFDQFLNNVGSKGGASQNMYKDDEELDDEWDFASKAKKPQQGISN